MLKMMMASEEDLEDVTIEQWFSTEYFESQLWYYWASMLAFKPYHSLIEFKRYTVRFMQHLDGIENLKGILRTKYDQYNSLILPLIKYLETHGVNFVVDTTVTDFDIEVEAGEKIIRSIHLLSEGQEIIQPVTESDIVYFTNGSMTQNSSQGSMIEAPTLNYNTEKRGAFTLWEKITKKADGFGHPEKFVSHLDNSHFVSFTITIKDYPELFDYIEHKTGNITGAGGAITFVESPWFITFNTPLQPVYPNQPEDIQILWGYGLYSEKEGQFVKKSMDQCNGKEIMQELLYQFGLEDKMYDIIPHTNCIPSMMPYITSQFMPRGLKDRPQIIPSGSKNLAFIGQFVELEGDVVFTVETSVRTAMMAVYKTMELDRPIIPLFKPQFDIRIIIQCFKKMLGKDEITINDLPKVNPIELPKMMKQLVDALNDTPKMPNYYPEREENKRL